MMSKDYFNLLDLAFILPEIFLSVFTFSLLLIILSFSVSKVYKFPLLLPSACWLAVYGLLFTVFLVLNNFMDDFLVLSNCFLINSTINYLKVLVIVLTIISIIVSVSFLKYEQINNFEYIVLLLFATLGNLLLISSFDMITMYLAIEIQSLALYVLVSFNKNTLLSTEAGLKYFILGSLSSIFILFGFAIIYNLLGTVKFIDLIYLNTMPFSSEVFMFFIYLGSFLIFIGFFFKLALAPFHMWAPDVYEGAPTSITLYMSIVPKIVFITAIIRFFLLIFASVFIKFQSVLIFVALCSILIGSFLGLKQKRIKRLLIYSSMNHFGFILLSISTGTLEGIQYGYVYLFMYFIMILNFWIFFISLRKKKTTRLLIYLSDLKSITAYNPALRFFLIINLFSMSGIPPLIGFWIKYLVILAALDSFLYLPIILAIFLNIISVFYYIRIIKIFYYDISRNYVVCTSIPKENIILLTITFFILFLFLFHPSILLLFSEKFIYYLL